MKKTKQQKLVSIEVVVDDGTATAYYRYEGLPKTSLSHDEDVSNWTDDDIKKVFVGLLDLSEREAKMVTVTWS